MDHAAREAIDGTFQANISRVKNLVAAYDALGTPGPGRPSGQQTDVLRSAVVLLHAALEDLVRSSSEELLPEAAPGVLDLIGFPDGPNKTKERFKLGELHPYKGQTVNDLIHNAVRTRLQRSNYNSVQELAAALERIGVPRTLLDPDQAKLDAYMSRRHLIVHRADKNPVPTRGPGVPRTIHIDKPTVEEWVSTVEGVGTRITGALR